MEFNNVLQEQQLSSAQYDNYLEILKFYSNIKRKSIFVKYFNISIESSYLDKLDSTTDVYATSGIQFDLYEYTPIFNIQSIVNRSSNITDLDGQRMDGLSSIAIHTIDRPKIHDIIEFYPPIHSDEIFKVTNLSTAVNLLHANHNNTHFELDIEYAPLKSTLSLPVANHLMYDLSQEKFVDIEVFKSRINMLSTFNTYLEYLNEYYDKRLDIYHMDGLYSIQMNKLISVILNEHETRYDRIFNNIQQPYYFKTRLVDKFNTSEYDINPDTTYQELFDVRTSIINRHDWDFLELSTHIDVADVLKNKHKSIDLMLYITHILYMEVVKYGLN